MAYRDINATDSKEERTYAVSNGDSFNTFLPHFAPAGVYMAYSGRSEIQQKSNHRTNTWPDLFSLTGTHFN